MSSGCTLEFNNCIQYSPTFSDKHIDFPWEADVSINSVMGLMKYIEDQNIFLLY